MLLSHPITAGSDKDHPSADQENSQNAPLVHATLETSLRFLNWIPLGYIFETKLISTLIYKGQSTVAGGLPPGHTLRRQVCHSPLLQLKGAGTSHIPWSAKIHLYLEAQSEWRH